LTGCFSNFTLGQSDASVDWTRQGTNDLAALCVAYPTRWAEIDTAEQRISDQLQRDPLQASQALSEGLRKIALRPLVVYFSMTSNRVEVNSVAWIG
jgi:hypothetical protein